MLLASAHKPKGLAFCFCFFFFVFLGKSKSESKVPIHIAPQEICLSVLFLLRHVVDSLSLLMTLFFFLLPFDFFWLFLFTGLDVGLLRHLPPSRFGWGSLTWAQSNTCVLFHQGGLYTWTKKSCSNKSRAPILRDESAAVCQWKEFLRRKKPFKYTKSSLNGVAHIVVAFVRTMFP